MLNCIFPKTTVLAFACSISVSLLHLHENVCNGSRSVSVRALEDPVRRLSELTELLRALAERQQALLSSGDAELREPLSPEARAAWDAAAAALRRLKPGAGPDTDVFIILLGHLSQQLFGAECAAAVDALQVRDGGVCGRTGVKVYRVTETWT